MNVCEVPDLRPDMEYQCVTEDTKTRVYLSVVRNFNEQEYKEICARRERAKIRKRIILAAKASKYVIPTLASIGIYKHIAAYLLEWRGSEQIGSEFIFIGLVWLWFYMVMDWLIDGED